MTNGKYHKFRDHLRRDQHRDFIRNFSNGKYILKFEFARTEVEKVDSTEVWNWDVFQDPIKCERFK